MGTKVASKSQTYFGRVDDIEKRAFMHDLQIDKISLVDVPANNREFLLFKSVHGATEDALSGKNKKKKKGEKMTKKLQDVLKEKGLSEDQLNTVAELLEDDEVKKALQPEKTEEDLAKAREAEKVALAKQAEEELKKKEELQAMGKAGTEIIELRKSVEALQVNNKNLTESLDVEKNHRQDEVFLAKAAKLPFIPMEKTRLAGLLRFISEAGNGFEDDVNKTFESINTMLRSAPAFNEIGKGGAAGIVQKGGEELMKLATERIAKGGINKSLDEVMGDIIRENPGMYEEHIQGFQSADKDFTEPS